MAVLSLAVCMSLLSCSAKVDGGTLSDPFPFPKKDTQPVTQTGQLKVLPLNKVAGFEDFNEINSEAGFTGNIAQDFTFSVTEVTKLMPMNSGISMETSAACDAFAGIVKFHVADGSGSAPVEIAATGGGYATFTAEPNKNYVLSVSVANPTGCKVYGLSFLMEKQVN